MFVFLAALLGIGATVGGSLFFGWMFMLMVGVVHAEWLPMVPTIGYWPAVLITLLLRLTIMQIGSND